MFIMTDLASLSVLCRSLVFVRKEARRYKEIEDKKKSKEDKEEEDRRKKVRRGRGPKEGC